MTTSQQIEICKAGINWYGFEVGSQVWLGHELGWASVVDPIQYQMASQPSPDTVPVRLANTAEVLWCRISRIREAS